MHAAATRQRRGRTIIALLAGLLFGGFVGGGLVYLFGGKRTPKEVIPDATLAKAGELELVPADATGFIHFRIAETWKNKSLGEVRKVVEKAGPEALKALDDGFVPAPSSIDRVTLVLIRADVPPRPEEPPPGKGKFGPPPGKGGAKLEGARTDGQPKRGGGGGIVIQPPPPPKAEPVEAVAIFTFSSPFDAQKVQQINLPTATKKTSSNGKEYWHDQAADVALYFHSDKVLVVGSNKGMATFLFRSGRTAGPLAPYLKHASEGTRHLVAGLNMLDGQLTDDIRALLPDDAKQYFGPLFRASAVSGSVVLGEKTRLELRAMYANEEAAKKAESDIRASAEKARQALAEPKKQMLEAIKGKGAAGEPRSIRELPQALMGVGGLGALNTLDEFLTNPPLSVEGNELVATILLPPLNEASMELNALSAALLVPYFQFSGGGIGGPGAGQPKVQLKPQTPVIVDDPKGPKLVPKGEGPKGNAPMPRPKNEEPKAKPDAKDDDARKQSLGNLKQIGLAFHIAHDANLKLPAAAITDADGKPLLSWRVAILPYIEQEALYKEFKLDEPWDSENNKKLIEKMPRVFANPRIPADAGKTSYKVFVGPAKATITAVFDAQYKPRTLLDILDGTSSTVLVVESGPPVEWTKPEDIAFDPAKLPELSVPGQDDICLVLADGRPVSVKWKKLPKEVQVALITANGAEVLPENWDR